MPHLAQPADACRETGGELVYHCNAQAPEPQHEYRPQETSTMPTRSKTAPEFVVDRTMVRQLEKNANRACDMLGAMANPSRLLILCQLAESEKSVGELQPLIGLSQSALSQHLAVLREKRIVRTRREGQQIFYSLTSREAGALMHTLHEQFCSPRRRR
jgi:DNA-binding transcriptional ArsR family regulator